MRKQGNIGLTFLLVMKSRSFLAEAICSFIRSEIDGATIHRIETLDEIKKLTGEDIASINLALLYADSEPANESATEGLATLKSSLSGVPIVLMGRNQDAESLAEAVRMGVSGYIPATTPAEIVKHALPLVAVGGVFLPSTELLDSTLDNSGSPLVAHENHTANGPGEALSSGLPNHSELAPEHGFTSRETDVLKLLGKGMQNKLIAHELGLKESTVKVHIRHIMKKLRVHSRTQAALYAQREFPEPGFQLRNT